MTTSGRFLIACCLLAAVSCWVLGGGLTEKQRAKLHPFFQSVVAGYYKAPVASTEKIYEPTVAEVNNGVPYYGAIIYTKDPESIRSKNIFVNSVLPEFVTARVSFSDILKLADLDCVTYVDPGSVNHTQLEVSVPETGVSLLHAGYINSRNYKGNGVIVLIYDTGIDWKHLDFRKSDTTQSRILYIWDQTLSPVGAEVHPNGFTYGVEYTQAQIEQEIDGSPAGFVRETDIVGHGTHVASIAAGNGQSFRNKYIGVAPEADIIVVKGGNGSFMESDMIDGLTYALDKASSLGKPLVLNWSIGGQIGAHDGSRAYEVAVNNFVTNPGRVVCISAGNEGDNPIHVSGSATSAAPAMVQIVAPSYTANAGTNNDVMRLDIWLPGTDDMTVNVLSPRGVSYTRTAGQSGTASDQSDGTIDVWNTTSTTNGHRNIYIYIHDATASIPRYGTWTITLSTSSASAVLFDGWLGTNVLGSTGATIPTADVNKTVGMPGTSSGAITVGSFVTKASWPAVDGGTWTYNSTEGDISDFSSIGPTADGRMKPDIAAPGEVLAAALSSGVDTLGGHYFIMEGNKHWVMQGTSMASPYVAGTVALMLEENSALMASEIKDAITATANSDAYASGLPNYTWGYGKLDAAEALARSIWPTASVIRTVYSYDGTNSSSYTTLTGNLKFAVRFSPSASGRVTGVQVRTMTQNIKWVGTSGSLNCEVYTNSGGVPGTKIGATVSKSLSLFTAGINNYIQMIDANADVTAGTDYHLVISPASPTDTLRILLENVSGGTRSSYYGGSTWTQQSSINFRIRPIVTSTSGLSGISGDALQRPLVFRLEKNYPNPFNPSTTIKYEIPVGGNVRLEVFDLLGRLVTTLVNTAQNAGAYSVRWDGTSDSGAQVASGVYFYRLQSGKFIKSERMLFVK